LYCGAIYEQEEEKKKRRKEREEEEGTTNALIMQHFKHIQVTF